MTPKEAISTVHCCMHVGHDDILRARDMAILALEKQIQKKPKAWYDENQCGERTYESVCPACGRTVYYEKFCPNCGQALDWS